MVSASKPPEPVISPQQSRRSIPFEWPTHLSLPQFEINCGREVLSRDWLLRQLRRTLAHEAAQMIIDDDKAGR